tara:strand:- start:568 stop:1716 length:1149 start_codon:yes stop_codon:yes gene_type:complete
MHKIKTFDIFAGCGGLSLGFHKLGFDSLAYLDWEKDCIDTLKNNFQSGLKLFLEADIRNIFDADNQNQLRLLNSQKIDLIIGGPPCQAYSVAGRAQDPNNMIYDYRNYLFESYANILQFLKPNFFIFENVPGLLSAKTPDEKNIKDLITKSFHDIGFIIPNIDKNIVFDLAHFGGAQTRKRVIIFGVNKNLKNKNNIINLFYQNLVALKTNNSTVEKAISDLKKLYPLKVPQKSKSHTSDPNDHLHNCRYHSQRDITIFNILTDDIATKKNKYLTSDELKKLYYEMVGKKTNVHKYSVLRWDKTSNTIPSHLHKDGLRHIHPDPKQSRTITMREAARLQDFPDNFIFNSSQSSTFKMIGNAVSPLMSSKLAKAMQLTLDSIK